MMRKCKIILSFLLLLIYSTAQSQEFKWKSDLDTINRTDFYSIPLGIDWLAQLKTDLSDVRIKNQKNEVVPFITKEKNSDRQSAFINFPVIENKTDSLSTVLVFDAAGWNGGDRFCLVIGNNTVERNAALSGSNDRQSWFVIDDQLRLSNYTGNISGDHFVQWLHFPFIRYRYIKLTIKNKGSDALPVLRTGIYTDTTARETSSLYLLPKTTFSATDSTDGNTYVWIKHQLPYPVDRITMKLSGPRFYKREVRIYKSDGKRVADLLAVTEFNSNKEQVVWLMGDKAQTLLAVIENGDNPPLKIETVTAECRKQELVAYLEAGKTYTLVGGGASAHHPEYDLVQFADSIPASLAVLNHGSLVANDGEAGVSKSNRRLWVWPSIIVMMGILGLLTVKLVREMKNKNI